MTLPHIPAYSRGMLPYLRPIPISGSGIPLRFDREYDSKYIGRDPFIGKPYLRPLPPLPINNNKGIFINGKWKKLCPFPDCEWISKGLSGFELIAHWQSTHQSRNDQQVMLPGDFGLRPSLYKPHDWWKMGRITDIRGRQEQLHNQLSKELRSSYRFAKHIA
jgi:hypothetical protein